MAQPHRPATPSTIEAVAASPGEEYEYEYGADEYGAEPSRRAWGRREWLTLAACAVLGTAVGVTGQRLTTSSSPPPPKASVPAPTPASTTPVAATVIPVAPNGTSFTLKQGIWQSQTYKDAKFGNLKKGIGLLLDLSTARQLTSVTFTADTGPLTVELRAGDSQVTDGNALKLVGTAVQANGATTLPATDGGSHRYWMIWVTQLPPGYQAKIINPVARG